MSRKTTINMNNAIVTADADGRILRSTAAAIFSRRLVSGGATRDSGLLPPAVRWRAPDGRMLLLEQPPRMHTITYSVRTGEEEKRGPERYHIPIPWSLWCFVFPPGGYQPLAAAIAARPAALASLDDPVYHMSLPNVAYRGNWCLPGTHLGVGRYTSTVGEAIAQVVTTVWNSEFNNDIATGPDGQAPLEKDEVDRRWVEFFTAAETTPMPEMLAKVESAKSYGSVRSWMDATRMNVNTTTNTVTTRLLAALE